MQFIPNGPDIPERLLQAHEDGRVVFFCGAGISYPADLPGFEELTREIFKRLHQKPNDIQKAAMKAKQFDTAIGLLEAKIVGERRTVRETLAQILTPDLDSLNASKATATHEALLTLGKCRNDDEDQTRLVTTNYDRLFEKVIGMKRLLVESFPAPLLPILKDSWSGLVYLHGLLTVDPKLSELNRLIVSSGDFGRAYLTEGWATRFVSELFRNYSVCFVGYSINDPVLRHMVDALAADRLQGESPPEMFAFGSYSKNKKEERAKEWEAKNVTPILYPAYRHHFYLHRTLKVWAETYRDGIQGKERIVAECAMKDPLENTTQDDFVGRLLWALSDPSGLPAKHFANMNPVPSLAWLEPLSEARYFHADLSRFGVPPMKDLDKELAFSLIHRPSPYRLAQWMTVSAEGTLHHEWDKVIWALAHWLTRHLNDPTLLLWLANRGGQLHDDLIKLIEIRLKELINLEHDSNEVEKDLRRAKMRRILENAPNAIPSPLMRVLWSLLLTGRMKSQVRESDSFWWWCRRFERNGLTTILRLKLREILTPRISLLGLPYGPAEDGESNDPVSIAEIVSWEIKLSADADDIHDSIDDLSKDKRWIKALPELLPEFRTLLCDVLDLSHELGGEEGASGPSYTPPPAISEYPQQRGRYEWTALIGLTRDAWLALAVQSPERAALEAESWQDIPYTLFRRLSFFAAAQKGVIACRQALNWLLADEHRWLWPEETEQEVIQLLVALAPQLDKEMLEELERAILAGPPREESEDASELERWQRSADGGIWLRLAKIQQTGTSLSSAGQERLNTLSALYPEWKLATDQPDESPSRISVSTIGYEDEDRQLTATPKNRRELIEWLRLPLNANSQQKDDWSQRCREDFSTTAYALRTLAEEDNWPTDRWRKALQAWSEDKPIKRSWRYMAPVIAKAPNEVIQTLVYAINQWFQAIANTVEDHEELFFLLANRLLECDHRGIVVSPGDPMLHATNHPVGKITQALLDWLTRKPGEDKQGLPDDLRTTFTELCDTRIDKYRHGRVLLAVHAITLFRVDPAWTKQHLLPLFNWQSCETEACSAWVGFLWGQQFYQPLMEEIKPSFLNTAQHYQALGEHAKNYANLLTFVALDPRGTFTPAEMRDTTRDLPPDGLCHIAQALTKELEKAGNQQADCWANKIAPYLDEIWPKTKEHRSPPVAKSLARLCVIAGEAFPEAFAMLRDWLRPLIHLPFLVTQLHKTYLCRQFPQPSLDFLDLVMDEQSYWGPDDLKECLKQIREKEPALVEDKRYIRLFNYLRRYQ